MIKKIVAVGPESTGKSMLCEQLAKHFNTIWCPEYARAYLTENGIKYKFLFLKYYYDRKKKVIIGHNVCFKNKS